MTQSDPQQSLWLVYAINVSVMKHLEVPMTVTSKLSDDGRTLILEIEGRFDFNSHQAFRAAYEDHPQSLNYVVDLRGTHYLDSSALGMLLLLRDHAGGDKALVRLVNCTPDVLKILAISNFSKLFELSIPSAVSPEKTVHSDR
ncbi:STAS domain protein [Pseudomonas syringae pv. atrofaciens]|nr:STAS domain protein [Pseudomonas syringae pv. atrofaciens]KPY99727.1 STAS domain protein [Pseudomonas syringae pv. aptata]RML48852.1 STAS domain protein [Pseudomonas syringae pv. pisi]RMN64583.1 STAS domain protein [Pseudomonas syringae]RMR82639.1 STAS domain protein [Pseudomonas coronafaciens pv. striafaciens]RMU83980.1 STAS domain protein [Pseudomonas savastanoi pv. phaseolicola]